MLVLWTAGKYYNFHIWLFGSWRWIFVAHLHHFIPHLRTSGFVTCGHTNDGYSRDISKWESLTMVAWCCTRRAFPVFAYFTYFRPKSGVFHTHWNWFGYQSRVKVVFLLEYPGGFNLNALTTNKAKSHDHIFTQVVTRAPTNAHTKKKQACGCGNLG